MHFTDPVSVRLPVSLPSFPVSRVARSSIGSMAGSHARVDGKIPFVSPAHYDSLKSKRISSSQPPATFPAANASAKNTDYHVRMRLGTNSPN